MNEPLSDKNAVAADDRPPLPEPVERFILQWGDLGSIWGVNRTIAQIHALLYVADKPLNAEDIAATLNVARSNVSNSLKELQGWNLIRRVPIKGDRRDHFEAETDLWEVALRIAAGRKAREIDPIHDVLSECAQQARADDGVSPIARERLAQMDKFVAELSGWYSEMLTLPRGNIASLVKLGARVARALGKS
ncbi:MAG: MarR family transcriptional regulator [Pseudomonadota bacterium]